MTSTSHDPRAWRRPDESAARPASARLVDPEDDLPITTYHGGGGADGGETAATTAIPRFDTSSSEEATEVTPASSSSPSSMAFDLMHEPEPLPYVQPRERSAEQASKQPLGPAEVESDPETDARVRAAKRRGTQDLGLMVLRVGLGAWLVVHGLQKAFGWWGGQGLSGYEHSLAAAGFQHAGVLTYLATGAQIGAGALLVLGLFTPVAAAVALAYLLNALAVEVAAQPVHGYFPYFLPEGHEYLVTLIVLAAALTLTGPGLYGFDAGRGWARRPFIGSFLCLLIGVGAGVGVWLLLNGSNPLH
ncbi:DoxX family protein [Mycolicibacterium sp. CBMA 226]|uniref:DoxX family protein n=1 Tax=Mycolicibacterium sp. CBMA 226 TaxID=2606611 RepID=UPI0012DCE8B2|nr:DoxX family protein [Mycolicibacterium sp. CBMA 226]MUL75397.1 DoxX family protein [Mycolicibacterium sp. CBMA 226]